mmetsp:Transcript_23247/g.40019  ORF Transcript_23247/g.40019 Transcript_23247/m.40019 type:complete len:511 (+) Transcript_23247:2054-3586(+)
MHRFPHLAHVTALVFCLPASGALADLTAAEVWSDWKGMMTSSGYVLSAVEATDGRTLTVSDMSLQMDITDGSGVSNVGIAMPSLRFEGQSNGTVSIELPTTSTVNIAFTSDTGEDISIAILTTTTDPTMTAAGDAGDITYDYSAASTELAMRDLTIDGVTLGDEIASASFVMQNTQYVLKSVTEALRVMNQSASIGAVKYNVRFDDPDSSEAFSLDGTVQEVAFDAAAELPMDADPQEISAMLDAGFKFAGTFTAQGSGYDINFSDGSGSGTLNTTTEGSEWDVTFGPQGMLYGMSQTGLAVTALASEFPVPLSFSAREITAGLQAPVTKSNDEQAFGMSFSLGDVVLSDLIWGMFDPAGQLPRTPANLGVIITGTGKLLFDYLDPEQAEVLAQTGAAPGTLETMDLNNLELEMGGARLTGAGGFTFDNSDMVTFDGLPRPQGLVNLTLTGGNTLLDTLVNMGFVPQEQAMGARMMMGIFAVPGEGPDTLTSRIEINPEGHVLANGQRIR